MTHLLDQYGLVILFLLVAVESFGVPLPGETALVAAAVLASQGHYALVAVVAVAAVGAIVGDNLGYWVGRTGGRKLLDRIPLVKRHAHRVLPPAERFFERHGGKTVFVGRFISILRFTAAWLAGISRMPWWRFLGWNAAGGIVWAAAVGLVAFYAGKAAADAISHYGGYAAGGIVALLVVAVLAARVWRRRVIDA